MQHIQNGCGDPFRSQCVHDHLANSHVVIGLGGVIFIGQENNFRTQLMDALAQLNDAFHIAFLALPLLDDLVGCGDAHTLLAQLHGEGHQVCGIGRQQDIELVADGLAQCHLTADLTGTEYVIGVLCGILCGLLIVHSITGAEAGGVLDDLLAHLLCQMDNGLQALLAGLHGEIVILALFQIVAEADAVQVYHQIRFLQVTNQLQVCFAALACFPCLQQGCIVGGDRLGHKAHIFHRDGVGHSGLIVDHFHIVPMQGVQQHFHPVKNGGAAKIIFRAKSGSQYLHLCSSYLYSYVHYTG